MPLLTDSQLEAIWSRAMQADDRSMIEIVERRAHSSSSTRMTFDGS